MNYSDLLFNIKAEYLQNTALIDVNRDLQFSYEELQKKVQNLAGYLLGLGLKKGAVVSMHLYNSAEAIIAHLAVQYAGLTSCLLDPLVQPKGLQYYLDDTQCQCLMTHLEREQDLAILPENLTLIAQKDLETHYNTTPEVAAPDQPFAFDPEQVTSIFYTSGTTSMPKGVMLMTKNYKSLIKVIESHFYDYKPEDRLLCFVPFSHGFGSKLVLQSALNVGAAIAIMRSFQPQKIVDAIEEHNVGYIYGVPSNYQQLMRRDDFLPSLKKLKGSFCAAAKLDMEVMQAWKEKTGLYLDEGYGLIETCTGVVHRLGCEPKATGHIGTYPADHISVEIMDENDNILKPGERGEIVIKGESVMAGYLNKPEETDRVLKNGWFRTGDMGYKNESNELFMTGRIKDIINIAGIKISPYEVETVLNDHPDVQESAVVGIDNAVYGEVVKAYVTIKPESTVTERDMIKFCQEHLLNFQVPKEIQICEEFPRNNMGKIDKNQLRNSK